MIKSLLNRLRKNSPRAGQPFLEAAELRRVLERERLRVDRNGSVFCLLSLSLSEQHLSDRVVNRLVAVLNGRLRATDEPGWLDERRIGIFLPDTPPQGAWKLADDLKKLCSAEFSPPHFAVYSYPSYRSSGDGGVPALERPCGSLELLFSRPAAAWKRAIDIAGSGLALVLLSPVLLLAALLVKLGSRGPVFFTQQREGAGGRVFKIYKFRTMRVGAEAEQAALRAQSEQDGPAFKLTDDPRITWIGRWLRRTSIDELPQLLNVLNGDMSLVGPRPLPCHESLACATWQRRRLDVPPGITCIWQVFGRSRVSFEEWVRMDLAYVDNPAAWKDLTLLAATIPVVLLQRGAK